MSRSVYRLLFLSCFLPVFSTLSGCGKSVESVAVEASTAIDDIKTGLNEIAESGVISSNIEDIRMNIGNLGEEDAAKKDALASALDELAALTDPKAIKAKATEMIKKL